jgi:hypothetical protein
VRQFFSLDWSGGIVGAIENTVRKNFPRDLRLWPLLQAFDWEAFSLGDRYFVMILKDKLQGIPAGNGTLIPFPHTDHPPLPPTRANVLQWQSYLIQKFGLRNEDAAMILPIHDCERKDPIGDYHLFSDEEKAIWGFQLNFIMARQKAGLQTSTTSLPQEPTSVTYNLYGNNARVNME